MLKWGGAPSKLFFDGHARTVELVGTCITAVSSEGDNMQIAPYLSRPIERTSEGMLGAIKWKQISEKYLIPLVSGGSWRFLYVVVDSSADNYKMMRSIIAETTQRTRLIVVFSPCFAHALSLMVKWSFGKNFKYGCMLRT